MSLPITLRNRDGRVEDFEADRLSRSLFASTEAIGSPNAFLARELTDSVLHFLVDDDGPIITTEQLADLTTKVVRELGHPALAKIYREMANANPPNPEKTRVPATMPMSTSGVDLELLCQRAAVSERSRFSLQNVYPRDLVSAHQEGLLTLLDLETPFELAGLVLPGRCPVNLWQLFTTLRRCRTLVGNYVAIEFPDEFESETGVTEFVDAFERITNTLGLRGIVNLNVASPSDGDEAGAGRLFADLANVRERPNLDCIEEQCLREAAGTHVWWHLAERDFQENAQTRLQTVVEVALERDNVEFAFDRPRRPIVLGPGLSQNRPAVLGSVELNLERFVQHLGGGPIDREVYLRKLASLARFAKSAGHARLDFLRTRGDLRLHEGFLLERAVQIIVPRGVLESSRAVCSPMATDDEVLERVCISLTAIRGAIENDSNRTLAAAVDFPIEINPGFATIGSDLSATRQLRQLKPIAESVGGGLVRISLKRNHPEIVKDIPELLHTAWRSSLSRMRFVWDD